MEAATIERELTYQRIYDNDNRLSEAIKILREQNNDVYQLLIEPHTMMWQMALKAGLAKDESGQYLNDPNKELKFISK